MLPHKCVSCVSVLIMSENQVKKRLTSICKSKMSKQRKHWIRAESLAEEFCRQYCRVGWLAWKPWMSKENFMKLCDKVKPFLQKQSTIMWSAIDVEKQVAVTLYYVLDEER